MMVYQLDCILVAVVSLTGQSIDSEGMTRDVSKGVIPPTAPPWLMAAHRYVERLHQLEALFHFSSPTVLAPNPLQIQAAFGGEADNKDACQALSLVGAGVLELMATLTMYTKHPWDDARQLKDCASALVHKNRLAFLLVASGLPTFAVGIWRTLMRRQSS